jgi:hypothetical protein
VKTMKSKEKKDVKRLRGTVGLPFGIHGPIMSPYRKKAKDLCDDADHTEAEESDEIEILMCAIPSRQSSGTYCRY